MRLVLKNKRRENFMQGLSVMLRTGMMTSSIRKAKPQRHQPAVCQDSFGGTMEAETRQ